MNSRPIFSSTTSISLAYRLEQVKVPLTRFLHCQRRHFGRSLCQFAAALPIYLYFSIVCLLSAHLVAVSLHFVNCAKTYHRTDVSCQPFCLSGVRPRPGWLCCDRNCCLTSDLQLNGARPKWSDPRTVSRSAALSLQNKGGSHLKSMASLVSFRVPWCGSSAAVWTYCQWNCRDSTDSLPLPD